MDGIIFLSLWVDHCIRLWKFVGGLSTADSHLGKTAIPGKQDTRQYDAVKAYAD
jgi:hypothetical protein